MFTISKSKRKTANLKRVKDELIKTLQFVIPEAFNEEGFDINHLARILDDSISEKEGERYRFTWSGKRKAWSQAHIPSVFTLIPDRTSSIEFDKTSNLFIEGDNLEVLKLLYNSYSGQIKMIYIDPPYNIGKDFVYRDNFNDPREPYLRLTGQKDDDGHPLTSRPEVTGRFHSKWLSMMYPRLLLAHRLLREDGVIFISINDVEIHNLRMIMDELFGPENFIATIIWEKKFSPQNDALWLSENHDYVLLYARNKELWRPRLLPRTDKTDSRYNNPDSDPRGRWTSSDLSVKTYSAPYDYEIITPSGQGVTPPEGRCWSVPKRRFKELVEDNRIWFGSEGNNVPRLKRFLSEVKPGLTSLTLWKREEVGDTQEARRTIREIFGDVGVFDTPKPIRLIRKMLQLSTEPKEGDLILDFFAGSCSTAHSILELNKEDGGNRRYIMVQLPEPTSEKSKARNAGYETVSQIGIERIRRVVKRMKSEYQTKLDDRVDEDLGVRMLRLAQSKVREWAGLPGKKADEYLEQMKLFVDPLSDQWNTDELIFEKGIAHRLRFNFHIQRLDIGGGNTVYHIEDYETSKMFYICLDDIVDMSTITELKLGSDDIFVCRDSAMSDTVCANISAQCHLDTI